MKNRATPDPVEIGGMTPLTTIDFPGELAAVLFLQGCPWRCGYCHNGDLIPRKNENGLPWKQVVNFLGKRRNLLDAVVFSGGEPTLHVNLEQAVRQVKDMGYKIGLHTAGIYPERLRALLPMLDWVGMDIKSARADYEKITGVRDSAARAWRSAELILDSNVAYEFRTTIHPDMFTNSNVTALVDELSAANIDNYVIQECIIKYCRDNCLRQVSNYGTDSKFFEQFANRFKQFKVRHGQLQ